MLVAQRAHTTSLHQERRLAQRLADPADGKGAQDVAVADDHDVAVDAVGLGPPDHGRVVFRLDLGDEAVDACDDVGRRLAAGTALRPNVPGALAVGGARLLDLGRRDALVVAVVPLADVVGDGDVRVGVAWVGGGGGGRCGGGLLLLLLPRVGVVAAEVEEFEGFLCA